MKTKIITIMIVAIFAVVGPIKADLVFDSGYNIFDDSYPYYNEVWVINDAILDVLGGSMGKLELTDNAIANMYSGDISTMFTKDSTVVSIYDCTLDMFGAGNNSLLYLYAYDVIYYPIGGLTNEGWIGGTYYLNDKPFSFSFYTENSYSHVNIVPEPTTLLLFSFGVLLLRKKVD